MNGQWDPTDAQQAALDLSRGKLVLAGAGSGKTTVMVERYLALLDEQELLPGDIVATTFARKAAASLKARIHRRLLDRIAEQPQRAAFWRQRRDAMAHARIQTLHSFCAALVRTCPLEAGVDPDVTVGEATSRDRMRQIRQEIRRLSARNDPGLAALLGLMTERSLDTVEAVIDRLLVEEDLRNAVTAAMADPDSAAVFLAGEAKRLHELLGEEIFDDPKKIPQELRREPHHTPFLTALGHALTIAERIRQRDPDPVTALSFDEVEHRALRVLSGDSPAAWDIIKGVKALLVDEFQDTSTVQWRLIRALLRHQDGGLDTRKAFFVGDEKQAIYGFRGANVTVVGRGRALVDEHPDAMETVDLTHNFRSAPPLLARLNPVLRALLHDDRADQLPFLAAPQDLEPAPKREGEHDHDRFFVNPVRGDTEGWIEQTVRWVQAVVGSERAGALRAIPEADEVAAIDRSPDGEVPESPETPSDARIYGYSDIAIIIRTRTILPGLELALQARGIPYTLHGGRGFLNQPEVRDLIHPIAALADPRDQAALVALLRGPLVGLSDTLIAALGVDPRPLLSVWADAVAGAERTGLLALLDEEDEELLHDGWGRWSALVASAGRMDPVHWLQDALDRAGAWAAYALGRRGEQRLANIHRFLDFLRVWVAEEGPGLRTLNRRIALELKKPEDDSAADISAGQGVNLLTMHAAKGLEYPVVILPLPSQLGGNDPATGHLLVDEHSPFAPLTRPSLTRFARGATPPDQGGFHHHLHRLFAVEEERAEERRVLYVAATRAEERLIVLPHVKANESAGARKTSSSYLWLRACGIGYEKKLGFDPPAAPPFDLMLTEAEAVPRAGLSAPSSPNPDLFSPVLPDPDAAPHVRVQPPPRQRDLVLPLEAFAGWIAQPDERHARRLLQFGGDDDERSLFFVPAAGDDDSTWLDESTQSTRGNGPEEHGAATPEQAGESAATLRDTSPVTDLSTVPMHAGTLLHEATERFGPGPGWAQAGHWVKERVQLLPTELRQPVFDRTRLLIDSASAIDWGLGQGRVRHEWAVLLSLGPVRLRGRIDLAWPAGDRPLALDLKTNDVPLDRIDDTLTHSGYDHQVRLYALALLLARNTTSAEGWLRFLPAGVDKRFTVTAADRAFYLARALELHDWVASTLDRN